MSKVAMEDEAVQTEILNTTTSFKGVYHFSPKDNELIKDKN